jgi:hypothetical protein
MEIENKTKHLSTDPKLNFRPDNPAGYLPVLYEYVLPNGFDMGAEKEKSAAEFYRLGLTLKQAGDLFHERMTKIIDTHKTAHAQGKFEANEENSLTPIEADNLLEQIYNNPNHPYFNDETNREMHQRAVFHVETLLRIKNGEPGWSQAKIESEYRRQKAEGFQTFHNATRQNLSLSEDPHYGRSHSIEEEDNLKRGTPDPGIGYGEKNLKSSHGSTIEEALTK